MVLNADGHRVDGNHEQAEAEEGCKNQPDDHVDLEAGAFGEKQHAARRKAPRNEGAERKGQPEHIGSGHAWYDRMGQGVPDSVTRPLSMRKADRKAQTTADQRPRPTWRWSYSYSRRALEGSPSFVLLANHCLLAILHKGALVIGENGDFPLIGVLV